MTAVFEQHGLRIQYPENWTLQQGQAEGQGLELQIVAPSGAFWSLLAFARQNEGEPLMQEILGNLEEQYDSVETSAVQESMGGFEASGHDTFFFYLDLLVANRMRCLSAGEHRFLIIWQAENRDFDNIEPVFQAITVGFLASLDKNATLHIDAAADS